MLVHWENRKLKRVGESVNKARKVSSRNRTSNGCTFFPNPLESTKPKAPPPESSTAEVEEDKIETPLLKITDHAERSIRADESISSGGKEFFNNLLDFLS